MFHSEQEEEKRESNNTHNILKEQFQSENLEQENQSPKQSQNQQRMTQESNQTLQKSSIKPKKLIITDKKLRIYNRTMWEAVLTNQSIKYTSRTELIASVRNGVPDHLRPQLWLWSTDIPNLKAEIEKNQPNYYYSLKQKDCQFKEQIEKDIPRTY